MKFEEKLKLVKKTYLDINPPASLVEYGWQALKAELETPKPPIRSVLKFRLFLAGFAGLIFLIFSFGVVQASQKALPGDPLYPVKKVTESIEVYVSGDKHVKVGKRAEEVIQAVEDKKDQGVVGETIKNYQDEVLKTKKDAEKSGEEQKLKQKLESQEQQFNDVIKKGSSSKGDMEKAIEVSKKGRGGADDSEKDEQKSEDK
ncbi:hypothetical protein HYW42_05310 [Candidatus Daviesbacteria bacterium]|nr:hypothetical protein [Candidatus Daviesbacteria bacterium]